jgi:hypothetical protein
VIVAWYDCTPSATSQNVPDLENLPAWLRTNKQMLEKGAAAFHRKGVITIVPPSRPNRKSKDYDLPAGLSVLDARKIHIFPETNEVPGWDTRNRPYYTQTMELRSAFMKKLVADLETSQKLKAIKIGMEVRGLPGTPQTLNVSSLTMLAKAIKHAKELEVTIDELFESTLGYSSDKGRMTFEASMRERFEVVDRGMMKK